MIAQKKAAIVRYSKPGTQPPIYLAGSFSNPEWIPLPMQHTVDEEGEYTFTKEVEVEEGKDYQYKFRVGEGDWWLLNEDERTVIDSAGNRNNLLAIPVHEEQVAESQETKDLKEKPALSTAEVAPPRPSVTVEKMDSEPRHGDDFGADATVGQKDAHKLRAQDAEPDYVVVRAETRTPDIASSAAEVADSAMILDRETPTPPMSDEEAGRTGYRRMSQTPIPEVAETAAEVADVAATLDKDNMPKLEMPPVRPTFDFDQPDTPSSGAATPPEDKVPLFAHECIKPPPEGFESPIQPRPEPVKSKPSIEEAAIDYDDPLLEEFPSERHAILERVRTSQTRLAEDQTTFDAIPPSPVIGANYHTERMELPSPSSNIVALSQERSPSLDSIPEAGEEGYREEVLPPLPEGTCLTLNNGEPHLSQGSSEDEELPVQKAERKPSIDVQEVPETATSLEPESAQTTTNSDKPKLDGSYMEPEPAKMPATPNSKQLGDQEEQVKEIVTPEEGPHITVQPATPGSSLKTTATDPFNKPIDTAKATAIEEENDRSQLTSRKLAAPSPERPLTPTSMRSAGKDAKSRNFLKAFWRVVFVEWIGGFIMRLCGGDRHKALLAISALLLITLAPAVYFAV